MRKCRNLGRWPERSAQAMARPVIGRLVSEESPLMASRKVLLLEFNELCPALLDRWIASGDLPHFARLRATADSFVTTPDVDDSALLEPWIQWYSVHTGLAYDQHRVFHLTDGARAPHVDIYRALIAAGLSVGSFSSMNVAPFATPGSFFAADPWTEQGDAFPPALNVYNRFVSGQVREYSNASASTGLADQAAFLSFLLRHGLSAGTVGAIAKQLASEKWSDPRLSYRRVAILDRLQADVFHALYRRHRPDFASFFLNSTAHLQHSYWRHLDPQAFTVRPDAGEMAVYGDAIRFGYRAMDALLGRFLALADRHGALLIFMTALSQQPFLLHEEKGGQHFHRLHDVETFLGRLDIRCAAVDPTMTHQYMARFETVAQRDAAQARIAALRLEDGRQVFDFAAKMEDGPQLYFGCQIATRTDADTAVIDEATGARLRFGDLLYRIDAIKSGRHHPDGALWIRTGSGKRQSAPASILDLFPTLLDHFGVAMPEGPARRGASLLPRLGMEKAAA